MARNIKARRLLSDLYKEGTEIRFGGRYGKLGQVAGSDGFVDENGRKVPLNDDAEVAMFVRPPDPVQRDMVLRKANAQRAKALIRTKREEESEEFLTAMAFLVDMSDETLVDYVLIGGAPSRRGEAERETLADDEWKDMTAYQDAMNEYAMKSPEELEALADDPDFTALMELDKKFGEQVARRENQLEDAEREVTWMIAKSQGRKALEKKALERRADLIGNQAYLHEYERQMRYFSVRDPENIGQLFFDDPDDLAAQPEEVQDLIMEALLPFITEEGEAKNSQGADSGSATSGPPSEPETSDSSTPVEQNA